MMTYVIVAAIAVCFIILLFSSYVKAPSNIAYVIAGLSKQPRILIGKGGFKIPFFERLDKLYLGQITVDIKTDVPVPTSDFINVKVDAVAKVAPTNTPEGIRLAAKNFLNMTASEIAKELKDSLQGNMREIIGTVDLKSLNNDRDSFSNNVQDKAQRDMSELGITILSCNIQNVTDEQGLIENMGADNTWKIKKDAANAKAIAQKEIAVVQAENAKLANDAEVKSQTEIAEKQTELEVRKAELRKQQDTQKAIADAAYEIQEQEQLKEINSRTVEAEIIKTKKEQELAAERIKVKQNELEAEVNKKSDAEKYAVEKQAEAELAKIKRQAEAKKYSMEQEAAGIRAKAEAEAYQIATTGEATAKAIEAKGLAEAQAMEKKAEAFQKYGQAAIVEMITKILPSVSENVAKPISAIDNMNVYGGDASTVSGNVPAVIKQTFDVVKSATGVDMSNIMKAETYDARVNKNIDIKGEIPVSNKSKKK
jgi:flotillin